MNNRRHLTRALLRRLSPPSVNLGDGSGNKRPEELRQLADNARTRRNFDADAFYRRRLCEIEPDRAGNWIQLGHALKEAGFHKRALDAYGMAEEIRPDDGDLQVHLGHLTKIMGDFAAAKAHFEKALQLGVQVSDAVTFELGILKKIDNSVVYQKYGEPEDASALRFFLSAPAGRIQESSKASMQAGLGHGDYSYAFAMQAFAAGLEAIGADFVVLQHPEYVSTITDRSDAAINVHLGFYPPERLRLLKGAYNINCFAWEFDRLRSPEEVLSAHAFADQAVMLDLADEIWMPSEHGAVATRPSLSRPVHVVPAPLIDNVAAGPRDQTPTSRPKAKAVRQLADVAWQPLAIAPRIQPEVNGATKAREARLQTILDVHFEASPAIFVTVFNAHDYRKQIAPMIRGFVEFLRTNPNALLLCKMTSVDRVHSINDILSREQFAEVGRLLPPIINEKIWVTKQVLTREEMTALYDVSDHYLCTSHAEGQNLPLLEAMGRGVVPVSVAGTAMDDYISEETAVVVPTEVRPFGKRLTARYGLYGLNTHFTTADWVADALRTAVRLPSEVYATKSAAGLDTVRRRYGVEAFAAAIKGLEQRLAVPGADQ